MRSLNSLKKRLTKTEITDTALAQAKKDLDNFLKVDLGLSDEEIQERQKFTDLKEFLRSRKGKPRTSRVPTKTATEQTKNQLKTKEK